MKKAIFAGAIVSLMTFSAVSVSAQSINSASYYVHPKQSNNEGDANKQHRHHHHHNKENNQLFKKHKKEVIQYLSNYLNQPEANVNKVVEKHQMEMKKLIFIAVVAKLSNKPLENVIAQKEKSKSFKDFLSNNNIKHEQFFNEMRRVHQDIITKIEPAKTKN
ncbi:hypothetical protein [Bacillus sp. EAC]|uniref:hypothetical protein n=1 Tax=Bacillus sp. EAC TaxID=1978338 RepID=UPI000B434E49|nr:hypothetical protein [Bacillus sp. EAC]